MIIKISPIRLSIISLLVLLLPLIQNQWLNLYLYDKNSFTIYKFLYFLSGLIFPIIVCFTSLNKFTFYKFENNIIRNFNNNITGKSLLMITVTSIVTLSTLITSYVYINFKIFLNLITISNKFLIDFEITKLILFVLILSILLLFKKLKLFIKKIVLLNFLLMAFIIWYSKINNITFNDKLVFSSFLEFENLNLINALYLLFIEIIYYFWSYISHGSYLSDWSIPLPNKRIISPCLYIIFFYVMIILYYAIIPN